SVAVTHAAFAVDGVIEINQADALAGGVTPGDAPGYPVTLSTSGSYRLTGSLSPANASAISITTSGVSLDLNGFRLRPSITGGTFPGIDASGQSNTAIEHGAVESFGGDGIRTGDRARIKDVSARSNLGNGISVGPVSLVIGSTAYGNGNAATGDGIFAGAASSVSGCTAVGNQGAGIHVLSGSTVSGNTVNGNATGLFVGDGTTVNGNTSTFNSGNGITTDAGCSIVQNTVRNNSGQGIQAGGFCS